ncbi:hypothetical protein [Streptomyces sp900116325]|uniref:hypothetical protein n=1 Tax=Streptomyces sp. 900116325 TaxID=3154295 RepID=UPI0033A93067
MKSRAPGRTLLINVDRPATALSWDTLLDGERLDFCEGAPQRDQDFFTEQMGRDKGAFVVVRQEAAREHLY